MTDLRSVCVLHNIHIFCVVVYILLYLFCGLVYIKSYTFLNACVLYVIHIMTLPAFFVYIMIYTFCVREVCRTIAYKSRLCTISYTHFLSSVLHLCIIYYTHFTNIDVKSGRKQGKWGGMREEWRWQRQYMARAESQSVGIYGCLRMFIGDQEGSIKEYRWEQVYRYAKVYKGV